MIRLMWDLVRVFFWLGIGLCLGLALGAGAAAIAAMVR